MIFPLNSVNVSLDVQIVDDNGLPVTGLAAASFPALTYSLGGPNADVSIALSDLAAITSPYSSGGVKERGQGIYRLDVPNAAFASAGDVTIRGEATNKRLLIPKLEIQAAGAQITTTSPVAQGGQVTLQAGDDYLATDGRALNFTDANNTWPDLTGASVVFNLWMYASNANVLAKTGTIPVASGPGKTVRFEPVRADTLSIVPNSYAYTIVATLASGHVDTLVRGQCLVHAGSQ
jgi:hypothetical protein